MKAVFTLCCNVVLFAATVIASAAPITWITFTDPNEQCFTIDVPQGWSVQGGAYRFGYFDTRPMLDLKSPDGKIFIRFGDKGIPSYFVPNAYHPTEGSVYDMPAQAQLLVARYRTGQEFAKLYAESRFKSVCTQFTLQQTSATAPFPVKELSEDNSVTRSTEGQAAFHCESAKGPMIAFVYARTQLHTGAGYSFWVVDALFSALNPADQSASTRTVLEHGVQTIQITPQWKQYQAQMDRKGMELARQLAQGRMQALAQQVQQFRAQMSAMQSQANAFERRMNAQAKQVQGFDDALVGITRTTDPVTGANLQVFTGTKSNYWINGQGNVVNSDTNPGPGFRQLQVQQP
jgi:hypothetical protein